MGMSAAQTPPLRKGIMSVTKAVPSNITSQQSWETNHRGTIWCHLHQVLPGPKRCSKFPMDLTEQPQAVSEVPWAVGRPTEFLLMTFQSFFLNVSHGLLSPLLDYCFPWWIFGQSAEGFLAVPAALRKGQSWGRGTKLHSLQSTFLWAVVKKIIKIAVFFLPTR